MNLEIEEFLALSPWDSKIIIYILIRQEGGPTQGKILEWMTSKAKLPGLVERARVPEERDRISYLSRNTDVTCQMLYPWRSWKYGGCLKSVIWASMDEDIFPEFFRCTWSYSWSKSINVQTEMRKTWYKVINICNKNKKYIL